MQTLVSIQNFLSIDIGSDIGLLSLATLASIMALIIIAMTVTFASTIIVLLKERTKLKAKLKQNTNHGERIYEEIDTVLDTDKNVAYTSVKFCHKV